MVCVGRSLFGRGPSWPIVGVRRFRMAADSIPATSNRDFFISYTSVDRAWAVWIAVELEKAGYTTVIQAFDFRPGSDFVHEMQTAVQNTRRTIAVLSPE